jgi:hypothetical protein
MVNKLLLLVIPIFIGLSSSAQVVGKTTTEQYKASFETKINID